MVFGLAFQVLLAKRLPRARRRRHEDARLRAVDPRAPGPFGARHLAGRGELGGRLAEVPDAPLAILGVPVGRPLLQDASLEELVLDAHTGHAEDAADPVSDPVYVHGRLAVLRPAVAEGRP